MIMISFLIAIFVGSLLLSLPISTADGKSVPYIDALFTAVTSVCVTGLVTLPVFSTWSVFGQIIILVMIQMGGLGIVTILSGILISFNRRFGLKDRMLVQDAFNHVVFGVFVGTFDAEVRVRVILFAFLEHHLDFFEAFFVAQVGEQWARVLAANAFRKHFGLCPQANDGAVFADDLEVVRLRESATAKRNDERLFALCNFGNHVAFHLAECGFAFLFKNFANGLACTFYNDVICIDKRASEAVCEGATCTALAAGHESGKVEMLLHISPAFLCA